MTRKKPASAAKARSGRPVAPRAEVPRRPKSTTAAASKTGPLAAVYGKDLPGLPRGKNSIPESQVREAQRERQLRAVMSAVAELGYPNTTIGDIVARARVSRREFYALFESKEACFIAACQTGLEVMMGRLMQVLMAQAPKDPYAAMVCAVRLNLQGMVEEPEFTRCIAVGTMEAGLEVLKLRLNVLHRFDSVIESWHRAARAVNPKQWREVPRKTYTAIVGGISELITMAVIDGRIDKLPDLEEVVVDLLCSVLRASDAAAQSPLVSGQTVAAGRAGKPQPA